MDLVERLRNAAKASAFLATMLPNSGGNAMTDLLNEAADTLEEQGIVLESYRNRMKTGCDWIPVTERLPDIGRNCLISPVSGCVAEGQFDGDGWTQYRWSAKWDKDAVTHWMPLPEPPKEEETNV